MADLKLNNLFKSYGPVDVIHGIDLEIESGEFCVFVGPSGCGKSTLLRMIAGLEPITGGTIEIDGEVINEIPAAMRGLAMVFQSYALYPHMSVFQNMSFGLQNLNMPRAQITERVMAAARMLQIDELMERKPGQLSGGQRQRIAIGRAVVREPKIFLFDEPLSNLDAELRVSMRTEITDLHSRLGNTMIYVTHDQVEALTMADKIAVLRAGRLEQYGAPLDLYNRPANLFVAGFIGSPKMNFLTAGLIHDAGGSVIRLQDGSDLPVPQDRFGTPESGPAVLGIRPGDLELSDDDSGFTATVASVEQLGSESFIFGKNGDGEDLVFTTKGQTQIRPGDDIKLKIDPQRMHIFDAETQQNLLKA